MNVSTRNQNKLDSEHFRSCRAMARSNGIIFFTTTSPARFGNWLNVELRSPAGLFCNSCPCLIESHGQSMHFVSIGVRCTASGANGPDPWPVDQ